MSLRTFSSWTMEGKLFSRWHEPGPLKCPPIPWPISIFSAQSTVPRYAIAFQQSNPSFPQTALAEASERVKVLMIAIHAPPVRCAAFQIDPSGTSREEGGCSLLLTEAGSVLTENLLKSWSKLSCTFGRKFNWR